MSVGLLVLLDGSLVNIIMMMGWLAWSIAIASGLQSCHRHQQQALADQMFVFGIYDRQTEQHLGNIDLSTIRRGDYQWTIYRDSSG